MTVTPVSRDLMYKSMWDPTNCAQKCTNNKHFSHTCDRGIGQSECVGRRVPQQLLLIATGVPLELALTTCVFCRLLPTPGISAAATYCGSGPSGECSLANPAGDLSGVPAEHVSNAGHVRGVFGQLSGHIGLRADDLSFVRGSLYRYE